MKIKNKITRKITTKIFVLIIIALILLPAIGISSYASIILTQRPIETQQPIEVMEQTTENKIQLIFESANETKNIEEEYAEYFVEEEEKSKLEEMAVHAAINKDGKIFLSKEIGEKVSSVVTTIRESIQSPLFRTIIVGLFTVMIVIIIVKIILWLVQLIAKWIMYKKAEKPGWALLLPVYKDVVMLEIAGISPAWLLIYLTIFIPFVGPLVFGIAMLVLKIITAINVSKAFGKPGVFAIGIIFLPTIFYGIIGFGKAKYNLTDNIEKTTKPETKVEETKVIEAKVEPTTETAKSEVKKDSKKTEAKAETTKETKPKTTAKSETKPKTKAEPKTETKTTPKKDTKKNN